MARRVLLVTIVAAAACARGGAAVAPRPPPGPAPTVIGADAGDRPRNADGDLRPEAVAGLYWQPYQTCDDCAAPAALAAYVAPDAVTARAITAALDGRLALGLPYVVHTDELFAGPGGLAVVTGAFTTRADAAAAVAGSEPIAGVAPSVIEATAYGAEAPRHVTAIDRGGPVPAWSPADVEAAEAAMNASVPDARQTAETQRRRFLRELGKRPPACTVAPGDLFVVDDAEVDWYWLAPVRCGGALAFVPWTATLLGHAAVLPDGHGGHRLRQVVGAACDAPIVDEWIYDRAGRHPRPPPTDGADRSLALGGC